MNFKEQIARDLKQVFHNCGEFAQEVEIRYNGSCFKVPALVDSAEASERERSTLRDHVEGITTVAVVLYVSLADLGEVPRRGRRLDLDGVRYDINGVSVEDGEIVLELGRRTQ